MAKRSINGVDNFAVDLVKDVQLGKLKVVETGTGVSYNRLNCNQLENYLLDANAESRQKQKRIRLMPQNMKQVEDSIQKVEIEIKNYYLEIEQYNKYEKDTDNKYSMIIGEFTKTFNNLINAAMLKDNLNGLIDIFGEYLCVETGEVRQLKDFYPSVKIICPRATVDILYNEMFQWTEPSEKKWVSTKWKHVMECSTAKEELYCDLVSVTNIMKRKTQLNAKKSKAELKLNNLKDRLLAVQFANVGMTGNTSNTSNTATVSNTSVNNNANNGAVMSEHLEMLKDSLGYLKYSNSIEHKKKTIKRIQESMTKLKDLVLDDNTKQELLNIESRVEYESFVINLPQNKNEQKILIKQEIKRITKKEVPKKLLSSDKLLQHLESLIE